jgi:polyhydroxyalkanoate synthesis regulator phasin
MDREEINKALDYARKNPDSAFANELRRRIETGQIDLAEYGFKIKQPEAEPKKGIIRNFEDKFMKPASNFLFGSFGKVAGSLAVENVSSGAGVLGEATGNEKLKEFSQTHKGAMEDVTATDAVFAVIEVFPGGGFVTKALKGLPGGAAIAKTLAAMPEKMKAKAVEQYAVALGATKEHLKKQTAKVVPELLDRGVHGSLDKIKNIASDMGEAAGKAVGEASKKLSDKATESTKPFIESLAKMRDKYVDGNKIINSEAVKAIDDAVEIIGQYGSEISQKSLQKIKGVLDEAVSIANKSFTKTDGLSAGAKAKEKLSNTIREFLSKSNPELASANKEFTLWKRVEDIVEATLSRKSTQTGGLSKLIVPTIGGGAGFASGDSFTDRLQKAVVGAVGVKAALKVTQSAQYKTWIAVNKNKIAEYMARGDERGLLVFLSKFIAGIKNNLDD